VATATQRLQPSPTARSPVNWTPDTWQNMAQQLKIRLGGRNLAVNAEPLRPEAFSAFGDVVENPRPDLHPSAAAVAAASSPAPPFNAISANQGSAIKYQHVTSMVDLYSQAPSGRPGVAVANMFVCASRALIPAPGKPPSGEIFPVTVLERHPYTTQTFIPLSANPARRYLVIVAPSLPPSDADKNLPVPTSPSTNPHAGSRKLPGRGLPDIRRLRAFIATAEQAVTYGAGTWHAPMAALGPVNTTLDFVVVQFANAVAIEDCQEVFLDPPVTTPQSLPHEGAVLVRVPTALTRAKL